MIEKNKEILLGRLKSEIAVYKVVLTDSRTPKGTKFFLGLAVAYVINPIDLIPDFVPIVGYLDDLVIVPMLIFVAMQLIPKQLLQEIRETMRQGRFE